MPIIENAGDKGKENSKGQCFMLSRSILHGATSGEKCEMLANAMVHNNNKVNKIITE